MGKSLLCTLMATGELTMVKLSVSASTLLLPVPGITLYACTTAGCTGVRSCMSAMFACCSFDFFNGLIRHKLE